MAITYNNYDTNYRFTNRRLIGRWLRAVAEGEGYAVGEVGVIFCSSERLLEINREYLSHDYYTDIITFDSSDLVEEKIIAGELYIDVETVKDNANLFGQNALDEMHRILVHGILHLCGQGDKSAAEAVEMRTKEEKALQLLQTL